MAASPLDPLNEQRLRDEVIYLHSLWHRGPPRPAAVTTRHRLPPSNTTQFKTDQRRHRGKRGGRNRSNKNPNPHDPQSIPSSGAEWPCPTPPPPETTTGWPSTGSKPVQKPHLPSPEDQMKFSMKQAQQKARKAVREFFKGNKINSGSDSSDDNTDDDDEFMEEEDERHEYTFFLKVLTEDAELGEFYGKNYAKAEFTCLVCGAVGRKNLGKRYKGCLALVQHSITIAKTKKRRAHRAYGQAVCKVLGWDIDRLPAIAAMLSDNNPEGNDSSSNKDNLIGLVDNVEPVDAINLKVLPQSEPIGSETLPSGNEGNMNSLTGADDNTTLENLDIVPLEETATGELTSGGPVSENNGVGIEIQESGNAILDELKEDNKTDGD